MLSTQPCVKFIMHIITYLFFICLLIASRLQYIHQEKQNKQLSKSYPNEYSIYKAYIGNKKLKYRFSETDLYFRVDDLSEIDILISIWILGNQINIKSI